MNYSSVTRAKIVVWTIVMFIILAGSSVLASWDKGFDKSQIINYKSQNTPLTIS
jgi:hypothetical protein